LAPNKRKILEAARKFSQKGSQAKALKEYNKLLKADPRDTKLLLEVGDAYRRWGQAEEAIAQYGKVAQQYRQDGFDARAVAVFKQILNLDPKQYSAYVSLSELYQRMGLDAEAISALQTAADGYQKEGRRTEALDLLRQTAALDPTNTTSRLKVAELLRQEGMEAEALSEYQAVAEELENQRDRELLLIVLERILEIRPEQIDALTSLVKNLMVDGKFDRAESFAIRALNVDSEPAQYEQLMELYSQSGAEEKLADATRGLAKMYRDRGDEEKARDLMQRLPVEDMESSSRLAVDISEIDEPDLADEDLLDDEPFLSLDDESDTAETSSQPELDLEGNEIELELDAEDSGAGEPTASEPLPEGDPDQLLAEANVYLRYGKRDQAIASLRGVLAQDAGHRGALEKLGEAYAADGQNGPAVAAWQEAAVAVRAAGDAQALDVLRDRIAAIDPAAAEQLGTVEEVAEVPEISLELDVEVDLDLDTAIGEIADSETQSGVSVESSIGQDGGSSDEAASGTDLNLDLDLELDLEVDAEAETEAVVSMGLDSELEMTAEGDTSVGEDFEFEIELDDEPFENDDDSNNDPNQNVGETEAEASSTAVNIPDVDSNEESVEFELDLDIEIEDINDVDERTSPPAASGAGPSTTMAAKIAEELEEAEFYLAQDMYDEAQEILSRVLELVPNHPSAMLRIGEIEAARGAEPGPADVGEEAAVSTQDAGELTFDGLSEDREETERLADAPEVEAEDERTQNDSEIDLASGDEEAEEVAAEISSERETDESDDRESFDLREALADVLAEDAGEESAHDASSGVLSTVEDGFGSIFSDFKKGVSATLEAGDYETRYDLGIAYREMGLYEDALGEFRVCLNSDARRFDSLHLMGICARDLLRFNDAVNHLEQALALPDISIERLAGVYFDLAAAHSGAGETERACATLRQTLELDDSFPGAADQLAELELALEGMSSPKLAEDGEAFESFDDLFTEDDDEGGDEAMAKAVPAEAYESFDDVIAEAEASIEDEEMQETGKVEEAVLADEETKSTRKTGRKKISFV
jgi:tetratricopeptide (TPR) repeat protein